MFVLAAVFLRSHVSGYFVVSHAGGAALGVPSTTNVMLRRLRTRVVEPIDS